MKLKSYVFVLGLLLLGNGAYAQNELAKGLGAAGKQASHITGTITFKQIGSLKPSVAHGLRQALAQTAISAADRHALATGSLIVAGPEGWSIQAVADPRTITLSELPTLPNGIKAENLGFVFGKNRGNDFLKELMAPYISQYPIHGNAMDAVISYAYEGMSKDPAYWNFGRSIIGLTNKFAPQNLSNFPQDLTAEVAAQEAPTLFSSLAVLSFREYVVKHGLQFPSYQTQDGLGTIIHGTWRRLFNNELTPQATNLLVTTYLYSLNARDVEQIVTETENFVRLNGRFPGLQVLTLSAQESIPFMQAYENGQLSTTQLNEVSLGMQSGLLIKGLPSCPELWNTFSTPLQRRITMLKMQLE